MSERIGTGRHDAPAPGSVAPPRAAPCVLIIDDIAHNVRLLSDLLASRGYRTECAYSGGAGLMMAHALQPDLILLDVLMPDMNGFDVCRRLRSTPEFLATPVVLVTSLEAKEERIKGLEAGADDFLSKPIVQAELFARVRSLLRVKALYDEVSRQRAELEAWAATLERRVDEKVLEIERLTWLKRFFSPSLAERLLGDGRDDLLQSHRAEVSVLFADLRGFTAFAESQPAEVVTAVLREFHAQMGQLIFRFGGTLERFTGDGMMVFFNDPDPVPDHAVQAVRLGCAMCAEVAALLPGWAQRGGPAGVAVGIGKGVATLGAIGFESRLDYAAIGSVTNLAARLCSEAQAGEVLVSHEVWADLQRRADAGGGAPGAAWGQTSAAWAHASAPEQLVLKGFAQPVRCHRLRGAA